MVVLVTDGGIVVSEHVQGANIEDLIELGGGGLVLGAGDSGGDGGSSGLVGEVRLLGRTETSGGGESTSSGHTSRGAQFWAATEDGGHCEYYLQVAHRPSWR